MEKGIVCLSFDDGRRDNYDVIYNILKPLCIPATINVTTGYIDGTCPDKNMPTAMPGLRIEEVQELSKEPSVEIALHGDRHLNTAEDLIRCRRKISDWIGASDNALWGFASPNCRFSEPDRVETCSIFDELLYIRVGSRKKDSTVMRRVLRKLGRVIPWNWLFVSANRGDMIEFAGQRILYSVTVMRENTVNQVCALIDLCIKEKKLLILQFHSITMESCKMQWTWDRKNMMILAAYIRAKMELQELLAVKTCDLFEQR